MLCESGKCSTMKYEVMTESRENEKCMLRLRQREQRAKRVIDR